MRRKRALLAGLTIGALALASGATARPDAASATSLPLKLVVHLHSGSESSIVARMEATTRPKATCTARVAVKRAHASLPKIRADKHGRASWQWVILSNSPSGTWKFSLRCTHGRAHALRTRTAQIITPATSGSGPIGSPDSLTTPHGQIAGLGAGDGNPFPYHQCTWLAWEKRSDIYQDAVNAGILRGGPRGHTTLGDIYVWDGMMWYPNAQKAGLAVGQTPQAHALVSFGPVAGHNPWGHVAYVEQVKSDTNILISQCNGLTGQCSQNWINPKTFPGGLEGYIYGGKAAPAFNPAAYNGHIVKQNNGSVTSWLVIDPQGHRNWIPDQATYNCLKSQGHPGPDLLSADQLTQLPDQNGVWAKCSTPSQPINPPTVNPQPGGSNPQPGGGNPQQPPPADKAAPSAPTGLTASGATASTINLSWGGSSDNVGVSGYSVYVNGNRFTNAPGTSTTLTGLSCGTSYSFAVDAYDGAGNHSGQASASGSTAACPKGADTTPPSVPGGFAEIDRSSTAVRVAWNNSTDNVGVTGYDLYLNGNRVSSNATSSYVIGGMSCGNSYTVAVDAYDAAGNHSGQAQISASTAGCPPPPPPQSVSVSKGSHATVSGCTASACAYIVVGFSGFPAGNHTVSCYADDPYPYLTTPFYTYTTSSTSSAVCVYGYPGYHVWASVDGVTSGKLTW